MPKDLIHGADPVMLDLLSIFEQGRVGCGGTTPDFFEAWFLWGDAPRDHCDCDGTLTHFSRFQGRPRRD